MKKALAMFLAGTMVLGLTACGGSGSTASTASTAAPAESTAAPAESTAAADNGAAESTAAPADNAGGEYKVAMICDSSINDGGWGAACYNAMVAAAEQKGWTTDVTDNISQDAYYDTIAAYCGLPYGPAVTQRSFRTLRHSHSATAVSMGQLGVKTTGTGCD